MLTLRGSLSLIDVSLGTRMTDALWVCVLRGPVPGVRA